MSVNLRFSRKVRPIFVFLLGMVITLFGCGSEEASPGKNAPLSAEGSLWAKYYMAGDLDKLMTLYTNDVIVALHGQPALFGKEAVRTYFSTRMGNTNTAFELEYEVEEIHGDIAYIISKYWLRAIDDETQKVYKDAGRSLLVYKKDEKGAWKIAADIDQATPDVAWPSPGGLD